jgi:hypothetical protein
MGLSATSVPKYVADQGSRVLSGGNRLAHAASTVAAAAASFPSASIATGGKEAISEPSESVRHAI